MWWCVQDVVDVDDVVRELARRGKVPERYTVACYTVACYTVVCYTMACYTVACYTMAC